MSWGQKTQGLDYPNLRMHTFRTTTSKPKIFWRKRIHSYTYMQSILFGYISYHFEGAQNKLLYGICLVLQ